MQMEAPGDRWFRRCKDTAFGDSVFDAAQIFSYDNHSLVLGIFSISASETILNALSIALELQFLFSYAVHLL